MNINKSLLALACALTSIGITLSSAHASESSNTEDSLVLTPPENLGSFFEEWFLSRAEDLPCHIVGVIGELTAHAKTQGVPRDKALKYLIDNSSYFQQLVPPGLSPQNQAKFFGEDNPEFSKPLRQLNLQGDITDAVDLEMLNMVITAVYDQPDYSFKIVSLMQRRSGDTSKKFEDNIRKVIIPMMIGHQVKSSCKVMIRIELPLK